MVHTCNICNRCFESRKGLNVHYASCKRKETHFIRRVNTPINGLTTTNDESEVNTTTILTTDVLQIESDLSVACPNLPNIEIIAADTCDDEKRVWRNHSMKSFNTLISNIYDEITGFRKNLFKIPSGKSGKTFIEELTFWLHELNVNSNLNGIALKTYMVLPVLMLQKPSPKSKAKDHTESLTRRLSQWKEGDIEAILSEVRYIQRKLTSSRRKRSQEDISRIFAKLIMEGKVSSALKFLDEQASSGVLTCTDEVLAELKSMHPSPSPVEDDSLLCGPVQHIPNCFFDAIDEQSVFNAASRTKGAAGPSGMDSDLYRRLLCSKSFGNYAKNFRTEIATFTRNLATKTYHPDLLEAFVSCRLIALDKNPGVRPIGIGEVLRRIVGKTISHHCRDEIKEASGPLQTCGGHASGAEAAIHAMKEIYEQDDTDAVLLIDASNAFNCLNRAVALHNIQVICPMLSKYIINTYRKPAKLFVNGGSMMYSQEGTTQGDPLAMPWYALSTTSIIDFLRENVPSVLQVWLADDATAAGKLDSLYKWYNDLETVGKKYGYYVKHSKCWLIVKSPELATAANTIFGKSVNITTDGKRHLGACIGSSTYKDAYCQDMVSGWSKQLEKLCDIADSQPQAAYAAFTKGFKSKFTYFLRTIDNFEDYTKPIDSILTDRFLPALFGGNCDVITNNRDLLTLNPSDGGIGVSNISQEAPKQRQASVKITKIHVSAVKEQKRTMPTADEEGKTAKDIKNSVKLDTETEKKRFVDITHNNLSTNLSVLVKQACDKGASSWLNTLPLVDQNLNLNKQEFRDALRLRYHQDLDNLPSYCPCGEKFDEVHAMSCKKGGFVSNRHDNIRDFLTTCLNKVCKDVQVEPHLIPVTTERFEFLSAKTGDDARLDMKARGFWRKGETAFFDVRVTHVNSSSSKNLDTSVQFRRHEDAKKREYLQRVLEVENGTFTPLIFGTNGGVGEECHRFLSQLAAKLADVSGDRYGTVVTWLRTRLSMELTRASLLCLRGSRVPFRNYSAEDLAFDNMLGEV